MHKTSNWSRRICSVVSTVTPTWPLLERSQCSRQSRKSSYQVFARACHRACACVLSVDRPIRLRLLAETDGCAGAFNQYRAGCEMKRHIRVVLIVVSAFSAMLWTVDLVWSMQEPKEVTRMSKQMKTVCVGRFLIDVPSDAVVTISGIAVDHFRITNHGAETAAQFSDRLALREEEIHAKKNQAGARNMERVDDVLHEGGSGKIFVFGASSTHVFHGEKKVVYHGVEVNGYAHVNGLTFSFISNDYDPEKVGNLVVLMKQLRPLKSGEIPRQPGFCLEGAFLSDPLTAEQNESIVMFAGLPGHEDLGIALATIAGKAPGPGLLERNTANRAGPYAFLNAFLSTLLEGKRSINGMEGDELAFRARERNFSTGYTFDWETQGTKDDVLHPFVSLELQTGISPHAGGEPVQSTLSEESLGDLWRRMSSSLRLRPVEQPAQINDADLQLGLALGTLVWAGEPCRQTGWWQCNQTDGHVGVYGGALQFLREGQVVPQALLLPKPGVWQKVRGLQPSFEAKMPTSWRLADKRVHGRRTDPDGLAQPGPSAPAPGVKAALVEPGHVARSGATCPASGWWRCIDDQALDGARWFAEGAGLPPATYQLSGAGMRPRSPHPQLLTRGSAWKLMREAAVPTALRTEAEA
jgi:hypothetical protein